MITYYAHEFTWSEFLQQIEKPPAEPTLAASIDGDYEFTKTRSYKDALKLANDGWEDGVRRLEPLLRQIVPAVSSMIEEVDWNPEIMATGQLDIGAFCEGVPECWRIPEPRLVDGAGKYIHIVVNGAYRASRNEEQIWAHGAAIAALVESLELAGNSVRLTVVRVASAGFDYVNSTTVLLKDWGESLSTGRLIFTVAHPSMLRRLFFRLEEQYPAEERRRIGFHSGGGYGRPDSLEVVKNRPRGDIEIDKAIEGTPAQIVRWVTEQLEKQGVSIAQ